MTKHTTGEKIEIEDRYDKDGYLVAMSINGVPMVIPEQDHPSVVILPSLKDVDWITQKFYMTPEEVKRKYGDITPK